MNTSQLEQSIEQFAKLFNAAESNIGQAIVGMKDTVRYALAAVFAGGHVLLEGVPGVGKTLLVKTIANTFGLTFKRIQFTPDLMPSDITGTDILSEDGSGKRDFVFKQGPIFANIVLADEINRATPKTQSALLEAMEERQVTVLGNTYRLPAPFFVLATQNPVELEGTYPLPEAQLDRFIVKLLVPAPKTSELKEILLRTTGAVTSVVRPLLSPEESSAAIDNAKQLVRQVIVPDTLLEILTRMIVALTPSGEYSSELINKYVRFGPGPRGAQSVTMIAKVFALLDRRINVSFEDIKAAFIPALRHRLILNFLADGDKVSADEILHIVKTAK